MGTILSTIGQQAGWPILVEVGDFAKSAAGPAMAVAIAFALKSPALVLFSMVAVGYAANALGGAGGPLAVLVVAVFAAEAGKVVSGETKIDILVTPLVAILVGCLLSMACGACYWGGRNLGWRHYYVGNRTSTLLHGNYRFGAGGHCAHFAYFLGCNLCCPGIDRPCGRSNRCRMLCANGGLCHYEL